MNPPDPNKILNYLTVLANFKGTTRTGMEGYHEYFENAGYAAERIREMGTRATDGLSLGLQSDDEKVRYQALLLIREIGDPRAREALTELSKTERIQRNRELIYKTMATLGEYLDVAQLTQDLKSDDVEVRLNAVRQLGKAKSKAIPALVHALQEDSDEAVRNEAAIIIGTDSTINNYRVIYPLMDMLQIEESPQVRANIALTLGANTSTIRKTVSALLNHMLEEPNKQVRNSIRSALQSNPNIGAVPVLFKNLTHPELESLITSTLAIYGKAGLLKDGRNDRKIDPLIEWMNKTLSSDNISTEQAQNLSHMSSALASVNSIKVIEPILKFIDANIQPYSHYAVEHLGQMNEMNATVALESLLDSHDPELRLKALTVLSRHPSESTLQTIQNYGKRSDLNEAEIAIIQKFSTNEAIIETDPLQMLKNEMQSNNIQTRVKAVWKLAKEEQGLPILLEALKHDAHSKVRAEVANSLGLSQMRNPDIIPHLIEAMNSDPKRNVREAAIIGLAKYKTSHDQISTAILERIPEEPTITHDAMLFALRKHPNPQAIPFAVESISNPKLSLRSAELLKAYGERGLLTQESIAPAIEWKNSLGDFESLDREQQYAFNQFEELLAILDASD